MASNEKNAIEVGDPMTRRGDDKHDISQVEQTTSSRDELDKDHINYDRIDKELAQYASATKVEISPEEDKRLKRMINARVLSIMVIQTPPGSP